VVTVVHETDWLITRKEFYDLVEEYAVLIADAVYGDEYTRHGVWLRPGLRLGWLATRAIHVFELTGTTTRMRQQLDKIESCDCGNCGELEFASAVWLAERSKEK